jgi:hypothetical protein
MNFFLPPILVKLLDMLLSSPHMEEPFPEGELMSFILLSLIPGDSHPIEARASKSLKFVGCGLKTFFLAYFTIGLATNGPELKYFILELMSPGPQV